jgi:glycerophosphoryl diester phosphodiesterase
MTLVVAHRGASAHAPENTFAAYQLALEHKADAIELDVHLTADGQLAVIHDETLDRTTSGTGSVAALTMDEVREADAGARFGDGAFAGRGLRVPTLPEVLEWLPDGIGLAVEIKARAAAEATAEALRDSAVRRAGLVSVISFDEAAIDEVHRADPELTTALLLVPSDRFERGLTWATEHGHLGVLPWEGDLGLDPAPLLQHATALGRLVGCYVVNDPIRMQQLSALGLWAFVTDAPDVAASALGR